MFSLSAQAVAGGFTLCERDVVAAEPYELSIDGVACGGLVIRLRGGGVVSIERDWDPCATNP